MLDMPRRRKLTKPLRYYDRDDKPYRLDQGCTMILAGKRPKVIRDREPERIDPVKRVYGLTDALVFEGAARSLMSDGAAGVIRAYRDARKGRRVTDDEASELLAQAVAGARGIGLEEGRGIVAARVARLLQKSEVAPRAETKGRRSGEGSRDRAVVSRLRRHRRGDE